jgi:hypothetical protein
MKAQTITHPFKTNREIRASQAIELIERLRKNQKRQAMPMLKLIKQTRSEIPAFIWKQFLYIDLLQQVLPTIGINSTSTLHSITRPTNPLSPYFLEAGHAKARHIALLQRYLKSSNNPRILIKPTSPLQLLDCIIRIWELALNVLEFEQGLITMQLKNQAQQIIDNGKRLGKAYKVQDAQLTQQQLLTWMEEIITFTNIYYLYCLKALECQKHL